MHIRGISGIVFALTLASVLPVIGGTELWGATSPAAPPAKVAGGSARPTTASAAAVRALSLHDRIAQLFIVRGYGDYPSSTDPEYQRFLKWIREDRVGG